MSIKINIHYIFQDFIFTNDLCVNFNNLIIFISIICNSAKEVTESIKFILLTNLVV